MKKPYILLIKFLAIIIAVPWLAHLRTLRIARQLVERVHTLKAETGVLPDRLPREDAVFFEDKGVYYSKSTDTTFVVYISAHSVGESEYLYRGP